MPRMASLGPLPCQTPSGANLGRIRTAQIGNRDKHEPRRPIGLEFALSGPDSLWPRCQNPVKAREFLGRP